MVGEPGQNIVRNEDHEAPYVTKRNETTRLACVSWGMRDERCNESFKFLVNYFSVSTPSKKKSIDSRSCFNAITIDYLKSIKPKCRPILDSSCFSFFLETNEMETLLLLLFVYNTCANDRDKSLIK